jgi:hypothetical protein
VSRCIGSDRRSGRRSIAGVDRILRPGAVDVVHIEAARRPSAPKPLQYESSHIRTFVKADTNGHQILLNADIWFDVRFTRPKYNLGTSAFG